MNEIKNSEQSVLTGKAAYVKPTMKVYEMEVEGAMLYGSGYTPTRDNSIGKDTFDGGIWGEDTSGSIWK